MADDFFDENLGHQLDQFSVVAEYAEHLFSRFDYQQLKHFLSYVITLPHFTPEEYVLPELQLGRTDVIGLRLKAAIFRLRTLALNVIIRLPSSDAVDIEVRYH